MRRAPSRGSGGRMILRGDHECDRPSERLVRLGRVWEQCDRPRALEGGREGTLVPGACAGDAAGKDLASVADESPQAGDLLVVDVVDLLDAEAAHLAVLALRPPASAAAAAALLSGWTVDCHGYLLKRDVVRVDVARRVVRSGNVVGAGRSARGLRGFAAAPTAAAGVEELHVVGDDLGGASLLAVLALPRPG